MRKKWWEAQGALFGRALSIFKPASFWVDSDANNIHKTSGIYATVCHIFGPGSTQYKKVKQKAVPGGSFFLLKDKRSKLGYTIAYSVGKPSIQGWDAPLE
jgi:hypothetical protein